MPSFTQVKIRPTHEGGIVLTSSNSSIAKDRPISVEAKIVHFGNVNIPSSQTMGYSIVLTAVERTSQATRQLKKALTDPWTDSIEFETQGLYDSINFGFLESIYIDGDYGDSVQICATVRYMQNCFYLTFDGELVLELRSLINPWERQWGWATDVDKATAINLAYDNYLSRKFGTPLPTDYILDGIGFVPYLNVLGSHVDLPYEATDVIGDYYGYYRPGGSFSYHHIVGVAKGDYGMMPWAISFDTVKYQTFVEYRKSPVECTIELVNRIHGASTAPYIPGRVSGLPEAWLPLTTLSSPDLPYNKINLTKDDTVHRGLIEAPFTLIPKDEATDLILNTWIYRSLGRWEHLSTINYFELIRYK